MKNSRRKLSRMFLAPRAEDIIRTKEEEISRREKKIDELQASRETASENQREQIDANIEEQQNEISRLEAENERIEERMSLRDRVKLIFKKIRLHRICCCIGCWFGYWCYRE